MPEMEVPQGHFESRYTVPPVEAFDDSPGQMRYRTPPA